VTIGPQETSKNHHYVPKFMLRRFCGPDGRMTVVRVRPEPEVRRGKHPRKVAVARRLNTWEHPDGSFDDQLEQLELTNLDRGSAEALREVIEYAEAVQPEDQLRLFNRNWEDRVPLTAHIAGLMVRGPKLREVFDEQALPAVVDFLRTRINEGIEDGSVEEEHARPLLLAFDRPEMVSLEPPRNRHQAILPDLIVAATAAIGARHVVAVRRTSEPMLTGSEPVVLFPTWDITKGLSCADYLRTAEPPIPLWEEHEELLTRFGSRLSETAGLAFAADPHTVVLMFHPESEDGAKLAFVFSEVETSALAGVLSLKVASNYTNICSYGDSGHQQRQRDPRGGDLTSAR
jgi:hypothetical protein